MVAFLTFFNEKNYVYDISSAAFVRATAAEMQRFFDQSARHKEFYSQGLSAEAAARRQRRCSHLKPDTGNMTSIESLPELYQLKANKAQVFLIFQNVSRFAREYSFFLELVRWARRRG